MHQNLPPQFPKKEPGRPTQGSVQWRRNKDGTITFYLRYQRNGVRRYPSVCRVPEEHFDDGLLQAEQELIALRHRWRRGLDAEPRDPRKWTDAKDAFLEWVQKHRPGSHERYGSSLRAWIDSSAPDLLSQTSAQHIESFQHDRAQEVAIGTANYDVGVVRRCWRWLQEKPRCWAHPDDNPFEGIEMLDDPESDASRDVRVLTDDEISVLAETLPDRLVRVMRFDLRTGLRTGELIHLHRNDVDLEAGFVTVRAHGSHRVKNRKPRAVPLDSVAAEVVKMQMADRPDAELVFPTTAQGKRDGEPVLWTKMGRQFSKWASRAGLDDVSLKTCRATCATRWARANVDPTTVQSWLGHSQLSTTDRYYLGRVSDRDVELARSIEGQMPG